MNFLTNLGVTEILFSCKLVLEGKAAKKIPESSRLELLEQFSGNNFALSEAEDNTSKLLNRGSIADLPLLKTLLSNLPKFTSAKLLGSNRLFCFISTINFSSFDNPFATITSLSEPHFRCRFITLVQSEKIDFYEQWQPNKQPKTIEMNMRIDLILTMRDI